MNRRETPRMDVKLKCHVAPMKAGPRALSGVTENISRNGVLMLCLADRAGEHPRLGETVTVEIELPENPVFGRKCIHCQATVVRIAGDEAEPFRIAFNISQMKFTEYSSGISGYEEVGASLSPRPV